MIQASTVYEVHCRTFRVLLDILSIPHSMHNEGIATHGSHPIAYFRRIPAYRCATSKQLRKLVADAVRKQRRA